jgi:signal transduction histidine kinase
VRISTNEDEAVITVEDNGLGIPKDRLDKIYDMYYRAGNNKRQGQGLGLHIVLEIVKKLDGKIQVDSEEGKGTRFTIQLPNTLELAVS